MSSLVAYIKNILRVGIFCVMAFFVFSIYTNQAMALMDVSSSAGTLKSTPAYPLAGDFVTLDFKSSSLDSSVALITWSVDGVVVGSGYGLTRYEFLVGKPGDVYMINVSAKSPAGKVVAAQRVMRVSDVLIAWEGDTYAPPLYTGRKLVAPGADATVAAFPEVYDSFGKRYSAEVLTYEWMLNGKGVGGGSGRGKTSAHITTGLFDTPGVTVTVKDPLGEVRAVKFIEIPTTEPRLLLYEDHPLLGILYTRALGDSYTLVGEEARIVAEPYHASAVSRNDPLLEYEWNVGGQTYNIPGSLVLRSEGSGQGSASVALAVTNSKLEYAAQRMYKRVGVTFGLASDVSLFDTHTPTP